MSVHWYAHHIGDYVKNTQQLSMLQHGAYRLLLDYYYINEGPIPTDSKILYRICRCMNQHDRAAVDYVLSKYFIWEERKSIMPHDSVWHHGRADEEIEKTRNISEIRKTSASKRYANAGANADTTYNHNHNHSINIEGGRKNGYAKPKTGAEGLAAYEDKLRSEIREMAAAGEDFSQ